ncbi:hypothetical protein KKG19_05475 [Patescibacteria group bacterium]|nr:hypothetical protein [Patescibacteria group bacterium]
MRWHKKENIVCFTKEEINSLIKEAKQKEIFIEMAKRGTSFDDLANNMALRDEISNAIVSKLSKDKDEVEIFIVATMLPDFYDNDCEICFSLKDTFNPEKTPIKDLATLKAAIKENSPIDFWILTKAGFSAFQLKRYRDNPTNEELLTFIENKLKHYGNNMGDINLLILLQPQNRSLTVDFEGLSEKIAKKGLGFKGSILIWFNEGNKFDVIVELYPTFRARKLPINP